MPITLYTVNEALYRNKTIAVSQKTNPKCRQGTQSPPWATISTSHLNVSLQPNLQAESKRATDYCIELLAINMSPRKTKSKVNLRKNSC
jgi:hypothetical protein